MIEFDDYKEDLEVKNSKGIVSSTPTWEYVECYDGAYRPILRKLIEIYSGDNDVLDKLILEKRNDNYLKKFERKEIKHKNKETGDIVYEYQVKFTFDYKELLKGE